MRDPEDQETRKINFKGRQTAPNTFPAPRDDRDLAPGELVSDGRYKIISLIGRGAVGSVYSVEQVFLKKRFALKTLIPGSITDSLIRRFQKEAQAASRLEHPNLVRSVDFGLIDGNRPFIIMDFVEGQTLAKYLKQKGPLPLATALKIFIPVCLAMDYAHKQGVVHRDITPNNIILVSNAAGSGDEFTPKIIDFGIAKMASDDEVALTKAGEIFGTPLYMSPEQCLGAKIDNRSDIYSLGCVFFEVLTGAPPFRAETALATMMQHREDKPYSLREASLGQQFPEALERIIGMMLAKDPADRYSTGGDVASDFLWLQQGRSERVRANPPGYSSPKSERPWKRIVAVVALAFVTIGGGILVCQYLAVDRATKPTVAHDSETYQPVTTSTHAEEETETLYSHSENGMRIFKLPASVKFGEFAWWNKKQLQTMIADGECQVPLTAKLMLRVGPRLYTTNPSYFSRFQQNDLSGLLLVPGRGELSTVFDPEKLNRFFSFALPLESVRLIVYELDTVTPYILERLGQLSQLHWLCFHEGVENNTHISSLKNLEHIKVFSIWGPRDPGGKYDVIEDVTGILNKGIKGKSMRRLELIRTKVTLEQIALICRIRTLDTVDLQGNDFAKSTEDKQAVWSKLGQLPELKRLSLGSSMFDGLKIPEGPRHLKKLKTLVFNYCKHLPVDFKEQLENAYPGVDVVIDDKSSDVAVDWFDPLKTDPAEADLW